MLFRSVKNEVSFNLPKGNYETENRLIKTEPIIYKTPELPTPERNIKAPDDLKIIVSTNPNKCSVAKQKGLIILDPSLLKEPKPFLHFILFHEVGHYDYETEWKCDVFAAKKMLELGYNPSQCLYAQYVSLSEKQNDRKEKLFNFLKQTKCQQS